MGIFAGIVLKVNIKFKISDIFTMLIYFSV